MKHVPVENLTKTQRAARRVNVVDIHYIGRFNAIYRSSNLRVKPFKANANRERIVTTFKYDRNATKRTRDII